MSRIYVGQLPPHVRSSDLDDVFYKFGRIREIHLRSRYAFIEYSDPRSMDDAIAAMHGTRIFGSNIVVERSRNGAPRYSSSTPGSRRNGPSGNLPIRTPYRAIFENVSTRINWYRLKEYIGRYVEPEYVDLHRPRLREGIAEFRNYDDLIYAISKIDGKIIEGREIYMFRDKSSVYPTSGRSGKSKSPPSSSRRDDRPRRTRSRSPPFSRPRIPRSRSPRSPRSPHSRSPRRSRSPRSRSPHSRSPHSRSPHSRSPHSRSPHLRSPHSRSPHSRSPHSRSPHSRSPHSESPKRERSPPSRRYITSYDDYPQPRLSRNPPKDDKYHDQDAHTFDSNPPPLHSPASDTFEAPHDDHESFGY